MDERVIGGLGGPPRRLEMRLQDEQQLIYLLRELIHAQDNVTHTNEKGPEFAGNTKIFIAEREKIYTAILDFVRGLAARPGGSL